MVNINEMIKTKVVETVGDTFEDAQQSGYSDSNVGLKSEMFKIVEHALAEAIRSS